MYFLEYVQVVLDVFQGAVVGQFAQQGLDFFLSVLIVRSPSQNMSESTGISAACSALVVRVWLGSFSTTHQGAERILQA